MKKVFDYFFYVCFSRTGRINRAWWWLYAIISISAKIALYILIFSVTLIPENFILVYLLFIIVLGILPIYTDILAAAKRFHDTNRSARNLYWAFLPCLGVLYILIVCGFFRGTDGENQYGESSFLIGDWDSLTTRDPEEKQK